MSSRPIPPRPSLEFARKQAKALLDALHSGDADALDATVHGSVNCHDALSGITTRLAEEITHGDYPAIADMLIGAGASLPDRLGGSEAVQDVLRRAGVPDPE